jgi:hypothetical protein
LPPLDKDTPLKTHTANRAKVKSWNFIKMHLNVHMHDDLEEKGTVSATSTKTCETYHGPSQNIYQRQTNFKNVDYQVSGAASS